MVPVKSPFGVCVATPVKRKMDRFNGVKISRGTARDRLGKNGGFEGVIYN